MLTTSSAAGLAPSNRNLVEQPLHHGVQPPGADVLGGIGEGHT